MRAPRVLCPIQRWLLLSGTLLDPVLCLATCGALPIPGSKEGPGEARVGPGGAVRPTQRLSHRMVHRGTGMMLEDGVMGKGPRPPSRRWACLCFPQFWPMRLTSQRHVLGLGIIIWVGNHFCYSVSTSIEHVRLFQDSCKGHPDLGIVKRTGRQRGTPLSM